MFGKSEISSRKSEIREQMQGSRMREVIARRPETDKVISSLFSEDAKRQSDFRFPNGR